MPSNGDGIQRRRMQPRDNSLRRVVTFCSLIRVTMYMIMFSPLSLTDSDFVLPELSPEQVAERVR